MPPRNAHPGTDDDGTAASRRGFLASLASAVALSGVGRSRGGRPAAETNTAARAVAASGTQPSSPIAAGPVVGLERVATGLTTPVAIETAAEAADRRFVADQVGLVRVHGPDGLRSEPFLDLRDRLVEFRSGFDERGLLGLAFHPEFATNRRLFVRYSAPPDDDTPPEYSHRFLVSEFRATDDGRTADPDSERVVLDIPEPHFQHNAGPIAFGPDGYLYVTVGDGGPGNDTGRGHVDDWYEANEGGNGQDVTENLLGSVLRIDVDDRADGSGYAIPADNPLVGREGLDEHYAWGFRNPWGMSFDGRGRLFVADVGQNRFEEVNLVEKGGNYGWNVKEGTHCFSTDSPAEPPDDCPDAAPVRGGEPLVDPVVEYPHRAGGAPVGTAVVGGEFVETAAVPALDGSYVFGDWSRTHSAPGGRLFAATPPENGGLWPIEELRVAGVGDGRLDRYVLGIGRDGADLYVLTNRSAGPVGTTGEIYRLTAPEPAGTIEFGGEVAGWVGRTPDSIADATNPAIRLVPGELYEIRWRNLDGVPHQFQVLDAEGAVLTETGTADATGETRSVRFLATDAAATYRCSFHPTSMRGPVTTGPPPVVGDARPTDPDDDGRYEDVNGDGAATPGDATVLFDGIFDGNPAVTDNAAQYDFSGDGDLTPGDASVLFDEVF